MLTVACVFVQGPYPYTVEYVVRLERMVRRFLTRPVEFVCLTDQPEAVLNAVEDISVIRIDGLQGLGCWNKLRLFDPSMGFHGRMLYLDLDSLIVAPLDPIVDFPAAFAITPDALVDDRYRPITDRYGRTLVRRFNSSVMVWDGGTQTHLWTMWTPAVAERLSGDQDWIGQQAPETPAMPQDWFPRLGDLARQEPFATTGGPMPHDAKVLFCKKPKNVEAVARWPWFAPLWGAA